MRPSPPRSTWGSRFGFIMATAGFAVGLGNVWRFPYVTGTNGGGAFLIVYVGFSILIGIPLLTAEIGLGRKAQLTAIAGMERLTGGRWHPGNAVGWLGTLAAFAISVYYMVLIGWIVGYLGMALAGRFETLTPELARRTYESFTASPVPVIGLTAGVYLGLALLVLTGLRNGVERLARFGMPLLLGLLVVLAVRSVTFPGAAEGLEWYLTPDFSALDATAILAALGQSFYSIGIGTAAAFAFGSYLTPEDSDVPGGAVIVALLDTSVAILAGLVIFPALFAFGLDPAEGPGLLFVTMTSVFARMPAGTLFGSLFFFLLLLAGITSIAAVFEVVVQTVEDTLGWDRRKSIVALMPTLFAGSVLVALSQGPWTGLRIAGMDLFVFLDQTTGRFIVPASGLALALYVALSWGWSGFRDDVNDGAGFLRVLPSWKPFVTFLIPVAVAAVVLMGVGLLG